MSDARRPTDARVAVVRAVVRATATIGALVVVSLVFVLLAADEPLLAVVALAVTLVVYLVGLRWVARLRP